MTCAEARPLLSLRLDGRLAPPDARGLDAHLAGCAACRAARRELERERALLAEGWPALAAPAGFAGRVVAALPSRSLPSGRARGSSGAASWFLRRPATALIALVVLALAVPPARATVRLVLERAGITETSTPPAERLIDPGARVDLEEARRQVPWRIRLPTRLPEGYRLVAVTVGDVHEPADGRTVALHYQRGDDPAGELSIAELRAAGPIDEPVEPGAGTETRVNGRRALLIDGAWEQRGDRM